MRHYLTIIGLAAVSLLSRAEVKRPVTLQDCAQTKYPLRKSESSLKINRQGTLLAYLVNSPNLKTNKNDVQLYIRPLIGTKDYGMGKMLASTPQISQIEWLSDGKRIAALSPVGDHIGIVLFDTGTEKREVVASKPKDIEEYAISGDGETVIYTLREEAVASQRHSDEQNADGYRIPNEGISAIAYTWRSPWVPYKLWIQRRKHGGGWTAASELVVRDPFSGKPLNAVYCPGQFGLDISPDGRKLLINLADVDGAKGKDLVGGSLPQAWLQSPYIKRRAAAGFSGLITLTVIEDLQTGGTIMPIATPATVGKGQWDPDSSSFFFVAPSPVGSSWERADDMTNPTGFKPFHLWRVGAASPQVDEVYATLGETSTNYLLWVKAGSVGIRTGDGKVLSLTHTANAWTALSEFAPDNTGMSKYSDLASDGAFTITDYEKSDIAPQLRIYNNGSGLVEATIELNPVFREIELAQSIPFQWKLSNGTTATGSLVLPHGYSEGVRYPLVIQTKNNLSAFVCDAGVSHSPSFAPQPLAAAGIMYLSFGDLPRNVAYPDGYPGNIGEAVFASGMWDSAVQELDRRRMIDPNKVGIIGFSRTGWHVEFGLAHGRTHYAAATAADNIQYSLGEYWSAHSELEETSMDSMYGGSPYGESLSNWMKYSISFNLDKIHTPLLMEEMGGGVLDDTAGSTPDTLFRRYEIVSGLRHLKKPVEMYYYPYEQHEPDNPRARLQSVQRNVDWYRFWLQGYERPNVADPEQYKRWEGLRELRDADTKGSTQILLPGH